MLAATWRNGQRMCINLCIGMACEILSGRERGSSEERAESNHFEIFDGAFNVLKALLSCCIFYLRF